MKTNTEEKPSIKQTADSVAGTTAEVLGIAWIAKKSAEVVWESPPVRATRNVVSTLAAILRRTNAETREEKESIDRWQKDTEETLAKMKEAGKKGESRTRYFMDHAERNYDLKP